MKNELKEFCISLNIEYVGIAPPGPYDELAKIWSARLSKGNFTGFEESCFEHRIDAGLTLEGAKSVIVCLFPYFVGNTTEANLSKSSLCIDYHKIVREKLQQIGVFLSHRIPCFHYKAFVDNGPLSDRHLAYLAGLGYFGLNSHIITDKYGSYVFIGYIINDYPFEFDQPLEKACIKCGSCIKSCPGNAVLGNFDINPLRCRSYLTQKKGELSKEEIDILKSHHLVFGCDICQDVCPHNAAVAITPISEFHENIKSNVDYKELLEMSNKEFTRRYRDRAFSWRGKSLILRNFQIINR